MQNYIVTKRANIQANGKEYHKDDIITAADVGEKNITRLLEKGYIRLLGGNQTKPEQEENPQSKPEQEDNPQPPLPPWYMTVEDYLEPEEVNKLLKAQLIEYAEHIGVPDIKPDTTAANLKKRINAFIDEVLSDEEDEPDDEDEPEKNEEPVEPENEGSNNDIKNPEQGNAQ